MAERKLVKESQFNLLQKITLFLLVLAGMSFLGRDKMICVLTCVLFLFCKTKFVVDGNVFTLLVVSVSWIVFAPPLSNIVFQIIRPLAYPLAYCAGLNFLSEKENLEKSEKQLRTAIIVVSIGPFIRFLLNFLSNMGKAVDRSTNDFWTGEALAATIQAALSLMVLVVAIVTLFTNARGRHKALSVLILVAIFIYNLTLAGRTLFVMLALIFMVSLLFLMIKGNRRSNKYKTLLVITIVILIVAVLYNINAFGIQDAFESSNFYDRFFGQWGKDLDEDSRMNNKMEYLANFSRSIWGGVRLRPYYGYAHDIFLDTYDEAGIFALIAMLLFIGSAVVRLVSCLQNRLFKFETQQLILAMYFAMLVQFMIEPILQGLAWLFMLFCFIHGMVTRLDKTSRKRPNYLIDSED